MPDPDPRRIAAALRACEGLTTTALEARTLPEMLGRLAAVNANLCAALERVAACCEGQHIVPVAGFLPAVVEALEAVKKANEECQP
jgi:hypothetical protein